MPLPRSRRLLIGSSRYRRLLHSNEAIWVTSDATAARVSMLGNETLEMLNQLRDAYDNECSPHSISQRRDDMDYECKSADDQKLGVHAIAARLGESCSLPERCRRSLKTKTRRFICASLCHSLNRPGMSRQHLINNTRLQSTQSIYAPPKNTDFIPSFGSGRIEP